MSTLSSSLPNLYNRFKETLIAAPIMWAGIEMNDAFRGGHCKRKTKGARIMMGMGMGLGFGVFGLLLMLLFWGGLIALAVWLASALFPRSNRETSISTDQDLSAQQILDRRYVRGEITRDQYELMKQDIE
jgi:putative membrane protein